jgi:diguanylate cyclase (GGDEF)-like protein
VLFGAAPVARFAIAPAPDADERETSTIVAIVARELGGAVKVATLVEESQRLAATDALTGLMNRRAFSCAVDREISRTARHGYPLSLLLLDIDRFKQINDRSGHATGDRVLVAMGRLLHHVLRGSDLAGRWGGEEFVVAYTSTDVAAAASAAERLRTAIEQLVVLDDAGRAIPLTASIGVAAHTPGDSLASLVRHADRAMYRAKASGRNRVVVCDEECAEDPGPPSSSIEVARIAS